MAHDHSLIAISGHSHDHAGASEQRLRRALVVLFLFTLVEAVGGFWANSIALLAEATHMLADCASLLLGIIAIRFGRGWRARTARTATAATRRSPPTPTASRCSH